MTYKPLSLADRRERLSQIFVDAERAHEQEWDSAENYNAYMADLLDEAEDHQKVLAGIGPVQDLLQKLNHMATEEQRQIEAKNKVVWSDFGEWLYSVWKASNPRFVGQQVDRRLVWWEEHGAREAKDMSEAIGADGGYLVPTQFINEVMALAPEQSVFLQGATRIPMASRDVAMPVLDQTSTTAGAPHWFGGIQVFRMKEAGEKTLSDANWREMSLVAHEIIGYARASNPLITDSIISLAAFLNSPLGFNGAIGHRMDWECFNGTGAGEFLGIIPAPATITVARAAAGTISYVDLLNMLQRFMMTGGDGYWFATQGALSTLAQISGPAPNPSYVWLQDAQGGIPARLLGRPIVFTEKLPALGATGDICLVNRPFYLFGDRQAITIEATEFDRWRYNQTSFRAVARNDGRPWLSAPFTLMNGVDQISPFVILGAVAS